jgi:hypothetical protein
MPERTREERIEEHYQESASYLAESLVDAEDTLRTVEGDCIRLSEELDDARAANVELAKDVRDAAHWEAVASCMRTELLGLRSERDRYRSAWLSARRRAVDEFNHGAEALALRDAEIARLTAELRKSTYAVPELECMGVEDDGSSVYRLRAAEYVALRSGHDDAPLSSHLRYVLGAGKRSVHTRAGQVAAVAGVVWLAAHLYGGEPSETG